MGSAIKCSKSLTPLSAEHSNTFRGGLRKKGEGSCQGIKGEGVGLNAFTDPTLQFVEHFEKTNRKRSDDVYYTSEKNNHFI